MSQAADAFYRTVFDAPGGPEALAPRMSISAQVLRNKANPHSTTNHPTLTDIERAMAFTNDYQVLHALAASTGHVCVKVDSAASASDMAVLEHIAQVWSASGDVGRAVNETLADGRVEKHEVAQVKKAIYRTMRTLLELQDRLEGMAEK